MSGLQLNVGLISGINFRELVDQLVSLDAVPMNRLIARTEVLEMERTALEQLMARFLTSSYMLRRLNNIQPFLRTEVASSNTNLLTVVRSGSANPAPGSFTFTPIQMASAQQTVARGVASDTDALGRTGTITLGKGWSVENDVLLSNINGGEGFSRGHIRLTDGNGVRATIDLRQAFTVRDVVNAINDNYDVDVIAELDGDRIVLRDVSGGDPSRMSVQEVSGGSTAASLGLMGRTVDANGVMTGSSIWRLGENMCLTLLNDGNGVVFDSVWPDLAINTRDGSEVRINFNRATTAAEREAGAPDNIRELTVGDMLRTINNSVCNQGGTGKVHARISDCGKSIVIEDRTTGNGLTSITQLSTSPVLRYLGLTSDNQTTSMDFLSGLTTANTNAQMRFQDKAGNSAIIELTNLEVQRWRTDWQNHGPGVVYGLIADNITTKLADAGVEMEVRLNAQGNGLWIIDNSDGNGTMQVSDINTDFLSRFGLANSQETAGVALVTGASVGTMHLTDQNGKSATIGFTRAELNSITSVDELQAMFTAKIDAANTALPVADRIGIVAEIDNGRVIFRDTTNGTASPMRIQNGTSNLALRLGLTTPSHDVPAAIAGLADAMPGTVRFTDQNGNTADIDFTDADLAGITTMNGLALMFIDKLEEHNQGLASADQVRVTITVNGAGNGLNFRDGTNGGTATTFEVADVTGNIVDHLGLESRQTTVTTFLAGTTPGAMRFIDQDGNSTDITFSRAELDAITTLAELADFLNDKLDGNVGIDVTVNGSGLVFTDTTGGGTASPLQVLDVAGSGSNFATRLGFTNPLSATITNATTGATPGKMRFIDQEGKHVDIDITRADLNGITSLADLAKLFNDKIDGDVGIEVAVNATGTGLVFNDTTGETAHPIQVFDVPGGGNLAARLGLTDSLATDFAGLTPGEIRITDRAGVTATFTIEQGELDDLVTLTDLVDLFNTKIDGENGIVAELNAGGTAIVFRDTTGGASPIHVGVDDLVNGTNILDYLGFLAGSSFHTDEIESLPLATPVSGTDTLVGGGVSDTIALESHRFEGKALVNHTATSHAMEGQSFIHGNAINSGAFQTRNLIGGLDTTLISTLNGGFGLAQARGGGAIEVQDRAGNRANLVFTQPELNAMHTLSDAVRIFNQRLSAEGIGITVRINDQKNGLQLVDTTGSSSHSLIFRDVVGNTTIPGVPAVPGVDAVSGGTGSRNAVSGGGNGLDGTTFLNFGSTHLLNGFTFAFTTDGTQAGFDDTDKKFTFYLDAAILAETDPAEQDRMVRDAINNLIANEWDTIYPPATYGTIPPPEVALTSGMAATAIADAANDVATAIKTENGGTLGRPNGTAALTFENTHWMNNFTFGFTTNASEAGYNSTAQKFTVLLSQEILDETDAAARDSLVKAAIDATIASGWSSLPQSIFGGVTPPTVKLTAGLGAQAVADAASGGETAIRANVSGAVMGVTHVPEVPDTTIPADPRIASSFGLNINTTSPRAEGSSLNRQIVSFNTPLAELNGGAGVNMFAARITISDSSSAVHPQTGRHLGTVTIDINSNIQTVGELIDFINQRTFGVNVIAKLNDTGDGITFEEFAGGPRSFIIADADSDSRFAASLGIAGSVPPAQRDADGRGRLSMSETHRIEIEATDSLNDIRQKINDLNIGYSASILVDGSSTPFRLSISGRQTGAAGAFNVDLSAIGLTTETMSQARDAMIVYGDAGQSTGLILRSGTNTFRGVVPGMDITITGTSNTPVTVTSERSNLEVMTSLRTFVENYNEFRELLNEALAFQVTAQGVRGHVLWNSPVARAFDRDMTRLLQETVAGIPGVRSLACLGITMRPNIDDFGHNRETGKLRFDEDKFEEVWRRNPEAVQQFFFDQREERNSDGTTTMVNIGWAQRLSDLTDTLVGDRDVVGKAPARIDALTIQIDRNDQRVEFLEGRLEFRRQLYLKQFYAMEQAMARMTGDMNAVGNIANAWQSNWGS